MGNRRKREKRNHVVVEVGKNYEFIYIYIYILENIWHSHILTKEYVYISECW